MNTDIKNKEKEERRIRMKIQGGNKSMMYNLKC